MSSSTSSHVSCLAQRPFLLMPEWCDHCPHSSSEHCPVRCGHANDQPPWSPMSRRGESDAYHKLWCCDCQVYCGDHSSHTGPAYDYEQLNVELCMPVKIPPVDSRLLTFFFSRQSSQTPTLILRDGSFATYNIRPIRDLSFASSRTMIPYLFT
ncbi:uncharacterized protein BT62DRAFT_80373 [Guyanagaster necrorhizus]|uniref:Uncharacterized protein n=1 Tax=Guyanagaster necrorhizus TaxID=856835 RepID=A0A9P8ATF7_9AGAR|nr:uncharacterized protein BT62DRAFT_80373 [Guyanagaster necrorhizus MCA 3950]KAG7447393.1 hypothetical protein BT62DRAFT_80373 [Guyanagaster necrorhizus MCA 3950]